MSQSDNRLHLRCWVRTLRVTSYRRGHSICLRRLVSHFAIGGALLSLPCVRGGAARSAAKGLYLTGTIFFCSAKSKPLQSLRRSRASSLYTREPSGRLMVAPHTDKKTNFVGGHSICPRRLVSHFAIGGALLSLPCVRGGAALRAAEGLYLTKLSFFFCSAKSKPLQSIRRSRDGSLYRGELFGCANIAKNVLPFPQGTGLLPPFIIFDSSIFFGVVK